MAGSTVDLFLNAAAIMSVALPKHQLPSDEHQAIQASGDRYLVGV